MRNIRRDLTHLPTISLYESDRCDTSHLNTRPKLPFLIPQPLPSSSNLRNPLSPPDDIYFPEYIHHENVYLCILLLARRSVIHTYILLPHVTPLRGFSSDLPLPRIRPQKVLYNTRGT